ncbi:S9 family peptidase [Bacillus sp. NTK074B]|uniref:alpha/beta hydrolase family protein n=1 Tax=Bacillus sp. NTK074B TaxID=2802174 RepID=UPI001A8F16B7|nr:S9 family peptidase [Bacillus sp. NTK074B]
MDLPHLFPYPLTTINQNSNLIHIHQNQIVASFEKDGDENYQLHHLPLSGGTPTPFHEEEYGSTCYHACFTDQEMYYSTNHENPLLNIYKTDLQTGHTSLIQQGKIAPIVVAAASSDGSYVYTETYSNTHTTAFYQTSDTKVALVPDVNTAHTIKGIYLTKEFIYFTTNYGREFSYLASFNLSTYDFHPLFTLDKEEITSIQVHQQSNTIIMTSEKGVRDHLYVYDLSTGEGERVDTPCDVFKKIKVTNKGSLFVLGMSADKTDTIFKRETNGCWTQVTNTKVLGVLEGNMIKPDIVHYETQDGLEIEGLLYKPEKANGITILWPHGGPQKAERMIYRPVIQYLVQSGYTLFAPNFRGSKCYGATFEKMVEQNWGDGPRHDCVAGMEWLIQEGMAEKGKIVAMGGSYGGYMSLLLAGRHPEYFCGIVDLFGISNLLTFLKNVPASWRTLMDQLVGNPETDYEKLVRDSPITYIDHMNSPMFIIHGENDPRVKTEESERIVYELKNKGVAVEYLVFHDEGHGFSKKKNEMVANKEIRRFLDGLVEKNHEYRLQR